MSGMALMKSPVERLEWMSSLAGIDLPASAIRVGLALAGRLNGKTGRLNPSSSQLQQDTGLSKRAVTYAIKNLEAVGLIHATRSMGRGHTTKYQLIMKERAQDAAPFNDEVRDERVQSAAPFNEEKVQASVVKGASQRREKVQALATGTQEGNTGRTRVRKIPASANSLKPKTIVELYHEYLPMCTRVRELTEKRKTLIRARIANHLKTKEAWIAYFEYVATSSWLTGKIEGRNGRKPFTANLEWLTREGNYVKVIEGNYEDGRNERFG